MLHLRVTPKASTNAIEGVEMRDGAPVLAVRVRALPDKGEANDAVVALLAKWLSAPKAKLRVAAGAKARFKQIFVAGDSGALMSRVAARFSGKEDSHG